MRALNSINNPARLETQSSIVLAGGGDYFPKIPLRQTDNCDQEVIAKFLGKGLIENEEKNGKTEARERIEKVLLDKIGRENHEEDSE